MYPTNSTSKNTTERRQHGVLWPARAPHTRRNGDPALRSSSGLLKVLVRWLLHCLPIPRRAQTQRDCKEGINAHLYTLHIRPHADKNAKVPVDRWADQDNMQRTTSPPRKKPGF